MENMNDDNIKLLKFLITINYNKEIIKNYNLTKDLFNCIPKLKEIFEKIENDPFYEIEQEPTIQDNLESITLNFINTIKTKILKDDTKDKIVEQLKSILTEYTRHYKINESLSIIVDKYNNNKPIETQDIDNLNESFNFSLDKNKVKNLYSLQDISNIYKEKLNNRPENKFYSFGLSKIDDLMSQGALPGEITILGGSTSMGKSVVALNMLNNKIELDDPCIYISTEMGLDSTMDRFFCLRYDKIIPNLHISKNIKDTMPPRYNEYLKSIQDWDKDKVFEKNRNTRVYFEARLTFKDLRNIIRQFKKETKNDYCYVIIDILTMITEFNKTPSSLASSYSVAMDELESVAKDENVHILGIVHFNRESDKTKILSLKDIEKVRPNIASVKNSSTIVDRARNFISCFCEEYYISRYLQDNKEALEYINNNGITIELQILKSSNAQSGVKAEYEYDKSHFRLIDNRITQNNFNKYFRNTNSNQNTNTNENETNDNSTNNINNSNNANFNDNLDFNSSSNLNSSLNSNSNSNSNLNSISSAFDNIFGSL